MDKTVILQVAAQIYVARVGKDGSTLKDFQKAVDVAAEAYRSLERDPGQVVEK